MCGMWISLIGAVLGGIIATFTGVFFHSYIEGRKIKKRICQALYDELSYNTASLKKSITIEGAKHSIPYLFLLNSYTEARNYGVLRELPEEMRSLIEGYYSLLQLLNNVRLSNFIREGVAISEERNPVEDEAANEITVEILPKLKEFCSSLRVYPHDDVAYMVRKIKG